MKPTFAKWLSLAAAVVLCGYLLVSGVAEELPVGNLSGKLVMKENGRPLADAFLTLRLVGAPDDDQRQAFFTTSDANGAFSLRRIPAGDYRISTSTEAHEVNDLRVTIDEGKTAKLKLAAEPRDPYLNLYAAQRVFTPDESPTVDISAFSPKFNLRLSAYRLDIDKAAKLGGYQSAMQSLTSPYVAAYRAATTEKVLDRAAPEAERDAEGRYVKTLELGKLAEGAYLVRCENDDQHANVVVLVSRIALVTKSTSTKTLCYVTDLVSGQPIAGASVWQPVGSDLQKLGTTDADGLASVTPIGKVDGQRQLLARHGDSMALVGTWTGNNNADPIVIATYFERPAYRPGDTIYFKGFVRRRTETGYDLPGSGTVSVTIKDPDDNPLTTLSLPVSEHGSFHGSFSTSPEAKPGGYNLTCKAFGSESSGFYANVVAYRKPEFSIDVTPKQNHFTMGETASATVECKYYYGGPVVGAKVMANIYRAPAFRSEGEEGGSEVVSYGGGEYAQQVEAVTDASGRATIEFPTRTDNDPDFFTNDFLYTVDASVSETDGRAFNGTGEVRVVRGDFDLSLAVQNPVVSVGETVKLAIKTTDPVDENRAVGGQSVTVEVGTERYDKGQSFFVPDSTSVVTTDSAGNAMFSAPVKNARYLAFRATSIDTKGRKIVASSSAYVVGSPAEARDNQASLKVTLDHQKYQPGESAQVLIQTSEPGGSALITVQTDQILWQRVVPLTSASALVTIPVVPDYAPNVYVTAAYVRGKRFLEASERLRVDREDRKLKIEIASDAPTYLPGGKVRLTVRTSADGKRVPAEVSVGVVDQGIYDISSDPTDLYGTLYPERYDQVQTAYSFPEVYLDGGDKGASKIPLRTKFRDTAAWVPTVWTGPNGEAQVDIELPDNLTGWRATAVGLSDTSQAGIATTTFQARKPMMVRLGLPQFLVEGDELRMTAVVANDTVGQARINLSLATEGLTRAGDAESVMTVEEGKPQTQIFDVTAGTAGTASITARVSSKTLQTTDGVRQTVKILPHGRPVTESFAGEGTASLKLKNGPNLDPNFGTLTIRLEPTLAGNLINSLDGLIDYPYGCVEQTMSRFLPSILVERAVRRLGITPPSRLKELPKIVRDSLTRLAQMRHYDGGWGWWQDDATEPFMTALVLDGLDRARDAGYDVGLANPQAAVTWALKYLQEKHEITTRDRLYLIYAVLKWGKPEAGKLLDKINLRRRTEVVDRQKFERPTATELAIAALAYHEAGRESNAKGLLKRLVSLANRGIETASWSDDDESWGQEPTALALVALETIQPENPIIPLVVRSLMRARHGDEWNSTRDTAYALIGLSAYLERTHELTTGSVATVTVNGQTLETVTLDPTVFNDPQGTIVIRRAKLPTGPFRLGIGLTGSGLGYYSVQLTGLETAAELAPKATDKGLSVERSYYRMEARRMENGDEKLLPSLKPVTTFASGDLVRVVLTIRSDRPRDFVMVDEPTPSACRVTERAELGEGEEWSWWWSRTVILDDKLAFFARHLPKGESKITYNMRAEQVGKVRALPTSVRNMYDPGRWASGAEAKIQVTE